MKNENKDIPEIYNYCNRWCERCTFTSRCLTFKFGKIMDENLDNRIEDNKVFWDFVNTNLLNTVSSLLENELEEDESFVNEKEYSGDNSDISRLINESKEIPQLALEYINAVSNWFDQARSIFEENKNNSKFKDSIEVIRWYHFFIYPKVMRAIDGQEEDLLETEFTKDSDGSVKVLLVSIEHSISAWGYIFLNIDDKNEDVFNIIKMLVNLQHSLENEFPNARNFIRPGFDEEV